MQVLFDNGPDSVRTFTSFVQLMSLLQEEFLIPVHSIRQKKLDRNKKMNPEIMKWLEIFHISLIGATIPAKIARAVSFPLLAFLELGKNF